MYLKTFKALRLSAVKRFSVKTNRVLFYAKKIEFVLIQVNISFVGI